MRMFFTLLMVVSVVISHVENSRAADKNTWVGRDTENNDVIWSLSKISGDSWVLKENGRKFADCDATQVKDDFVELNMSGGGKVRINNGKLQMTKPGTKTGWINVANGKWQN